MNFGDDPLADVLSDGSNDSFFDEPRTKRSSLTKTPEKKSITDLFNISDKTAPTTTSKRSDDWLGLDPKSPTRTPKVAKRISFEDDDDILGLGKSARTKTEDESKSGKKLDLFESILGPSKVDDTVKKPSFEDILKESKAKAGTPTSITPKQTPVSTPNVDLPREGRRGRRSSGGLLDPLGLFSSEPQQEQTIGAVDEPTISKPVQTKSAPNISQSEQGLPEWLGGSTVKLSKSENILATKEEVEPGPVPTTTLEPQTTIRVDNAESQAALNSIVTQQKLAHSQMEYQNTSIALQQQESQLLVALQLKKYEENMSEMQQKQQEILVKQEQQFNLLLERQFAKQQIMENNMRLQQERINNHIQVLLAQPPVSKHSNQEINELKKTESEESVKMFENIITSLKQRQHEETFILEESYKKQITLLEQTLESVEKRLKSDVEKLTDVVEEKLKVVQQQHDEEIAKYKRKIQEIEAQHSEELKQMRENNARIIEEIKFEHSTLLENIKEAKKSESVLFQESGSYVQKLDSNIELLYANSRNILELKDHVERDYGVLSKAREESLKAREQEIILMKATLEKCRESAEKERAELLGLVRTLETKISEQNQNAREERWAFQQAASTLAVRSAALDREAEFNRTSIERERDQLKTLKATVLAEQEKMMLQLTEEKLALSAEKSRLETSAKLAMNYDAQRAKSEIEAAVQVAKEAAEMTDRERESLQREKCEVEKLKRSLLDQGRKQSVREHELEKLAKDAERKASEGERAIFESKTIEKKYNERLRDLQGQLVVLSNREKKLAEEKIALSKERLALNTLARQSRTCGLCKADPQKLEEKTLNLTISPYFSRFDNIDDEITRLRLDATDESSLNVGDDVPK